MWEGVSTTPIHMREPGGMRAGSVRWGMRTTRVILETVNALVLGVWAGMLVFVGIAAALTFPRMKGLDPTLAGFSSYEGEHWRLVAGSVMTPLFGIVSATGSVVLLIVLVITVSRFKARDRRTGSLARKIEAGALLLLCLAHVINTYALWRPRTRLFDEHLELARAGDNPGAAAVVSEFNALHERAAPLMGLLLLLVIVFAVVRMVNRFRDASASEVDS